MRASRTNNAALLLRAFGSIFSHVMSGRRTLMVDAAVSACGFLDSPNVTAVELTPVFNFGSILLFFREMHRIAQLTISPFLAGYRGRASSLSLR